MMKRILFLLGVASCFSSAFSLSCVRCEDAECRNVTCPGTVVKDACGCCPDCSKQRGESCGGPWDISGICDPEKNLTCVKFVRKDELEFNIEGTCQPNGTQDRCSFPQVFTECASACQPTCDEPIPAFCTLQCVVDQCVCGPGFIRRSNTNRTCVPSEECEIAPPRGCEFPKIFSDCATACPATCGNPHPFLCTLNCAADPCICPSGHLMRSLTDRRCVRAYECEDFSFCDKTCPQLSLTSSPCELQKAWSCELDNWKCNTYKWKMEMDKWWTESCSSDTSEILAMWEKMSVCDTGVQIRCINQEMTECDTDAFGCWMCDCSDGKYEDARQLLSMWKRNFDTYMKYMGVYKEVRSMCDAMP